MECGEEVGNLSFGRGVSGSRLLKVSLARDRLKTLGGAEGLGRSQVPDGALERVGGNGGAGGVRAVECLAHGREQAWCVPGKELGEPLFEGRVGRRDLIDALGRCWRTRNDSLDRLEEGLRILPPRAMPRPRAPQ
jgi:hypothetical protein